MDLIKIFFVGIVFIVLFVWSCNGFDDVDVLVLFMQIIFFVFVLVFGVVCGGMEDFVFIVFGGEMLIVIFCFSDDCLLLQYKVDIYNNFDCYGYGGVVVLGVVVLNVSNQMEDWMVFDIQGFLGECIEEQLQLQVFIDVILGFYYFQI